MVHIFDSYSISSSLRGKLQGFVSANPFPIGTVVKVGEIEYTVKSTEAFTFRCFTKRKAYFLSSGLYSFRSESHILKLAESIGITSIKVFAIAIMMGIKTDKSSDTANVYYNHFTEKDINEILTNQITNR